MAFLREPLPPRDTALPVLPGISRIVAENPGPMTYHGTNTYLIEGADGLTVLDPGPDDPTHVQALLKAGAGRIVRIALSHTHRDHVGAVPALRAATGAPVGGFAPSALEGFTPDIAIASGETFAGLTALHTPGHAADHLCFSMPGADGQKILFSADHVMSWSSSIVSPPNGDMAAYFNSLRLLLDRDDDIYLPGHGPPLPNPRDLVRGLLNHRLMRETAIANALTKIPANTHALMDRLYSQVDPHLRMAAERNVLAHLLKLEREGRAQRDGEGWLAA
jgi:glyoxylase-like metal-dependent hydrolase (beta-lactamase superfamily II)